MHVGDKVAALIEGGEPIAGCESIEIVAVRSSRMEIIEFARQLGMWGATFSSAGPNDSDMASAVADPAGFVWRIGTESAWRPSRDFAPNFPGF